MGEVERMYSEPDGEASYTRCLLTVMAKGSCTAVEIVSGQPVPDLSQFQLRNADDLHWINTMPFKYDRLDAGLVIKILLRSAGHRWFQFWVKSWSLPSALARSSGELKNVSFWLALTKSKEGARALRVERLTKD
jgi:hypothetical protein